MIGKTHLAGGVATAAVICLIGRIEIAPAIGGIACSALGALLPDVDHKGSMMGKKIKPNCNCYKVLSVEFLRKHCFISFERIKNV